MQSFVGGNIHKHTYTSSSLLEGGLKWHTHPNTHTSRSASLAHFQERPHYIYTQVVVYWRGGGADNRHIHTAVPTLDCLHKHIYTSWRVLSQLYEHLLYKYAALHAACILIHQCEICLFSRDVPIADCTVRHMGVER